MNVIAFIALFGLVAKAQYIPRERPVGTDGQYHPTSESIHTFNCGSIIATLGYRQERIPEEEVERLEDTLRVQLLYLSIGGRNLESAELDKARALFSSFGWIERVDAMCYEGRVTIDVRGMPLGPFMASIRTPEADLPETRIRSLRLGPNGIEYLSEAEW